MEYLFWGYRIDRRVKLGAQLVESPGRMLDLTWVPSSVSGP